MLFDWQDLHGAPGSQNNLDNSGVSDPTIPVDVRHLFTADPLAHHM